MHGVRIEQLDPEDVGAARALILAGLSERFGALDPTQNPDLADVLRVYAAGRFLVARAAGAVVGTGAWLPLAETTVQIHRMSVAAERRGRGIGSALLARLLADARDRGFRRAVVETTDTWSDAIAFYERRGFVVFDRRPGEVYLERDLGTRGSVRP